MMNNQKQINLLDTAVPSIGVETLRPTPFRRAVKSLKTSAAKVANAAKRRWNKFFDWLMSYVPPTERINPSSTIQKLKNRIKQLFHSSPHFEARIVLNNYFTALLISKLKRKSEL